MKYYIRIICKSGYKYKDNSGNKLNNQKQTLVIRKYRWKQWTQKLINCIRCEKRKGRNNYEFR